jgi:hypothetical protein
MALVVVGAMAGTSPAMAANKKAKTSVSKAWQNQHKDNKVFGDAINNLRRGSDQTNFTISKITEQSVAALTALKDGLTAVGDSYTNFEYGVVALGSDTNGQFNPIPGAFLATPRMDPTVEQATVTGQFPCVQAAVLPAPYRAALANGCSTDQIRAEVAVRSANPQRDNDGSTAKCRVTVSQSNQLVGVANGASFVTTKPSGGVPAQTVPRSPLVPTNPAEEKLFPLSLVGTDIAVNLTNGSNSTASFAPKTTMNGLSLAAIGGTASDAGGGMLNVTLSCLVIPKS